MGYKADGCGRAFSLAGNSPVPTRAGQRAPRDSQGLRYGRGGWVYDLQDRCWVQLPMHGPPSLLHARCHRGCALSASRTAARLVAIVSKPYAAALTSWCASPRQLQQRERSEGAC